MNSPLIQLLVLAGIAVFLILRLRSVLGTREGFEKPPATQVPDKPSRPDFEVIEGGPDRDIIDHVEDGSFQSQIGLMEALVLDRESEGAGLDGLLAREAASAKKGDPDLASQGLAQLPLQAGAAERLDVGVSTGTFVVALLSNCDGLTKGRQRATWQQKC